ncbi:hypothetical protein [Nonomuraea sp. B1E8]|uniref:hypothetical protein n=1 Tax=unclassified Nonomuraea TaxID=2593643 RepID=UPI00325C79F5
MLIERAIAGEFSAEERTASRALPARCVEAIARATPESRPAATPGRAGRFDVSRITTYSFSSPRV